jgi:phage I-like protein
MPNLEISEEVFDRTVDPRNKLGGRSGNDLGFWLDPENMTFADEPTEEGNTSSEIQICQTGHYFHWLYGEFDITPTNLRKMQSNDKKSDRRVVIDYNHSSYSSDPAQAIAAGWMVKGSLKVRHKGQFLYCTVEWTPLAVQRIKDKEYLFISPEIDWKFIEPKTGIEMGASLMAAALTNRPFLEGMDEVSLSNSFFSTSSIIVPISPQPKERGSTGGKRMLTDKQVREILELSATEEIAEEHQNKAIVKLALIREEHLKSSSTAPDPPETPTTPDPEHIQLTRIEYNELKLNAETGADAAKQLKVTQIESLVQLAMQKGKITPSERESMIKLANTDFKMAKEILDARPERPELFSEIGSGDSGEGAGTTDALETFRKDQAFYSSLGITEEDMDKYGHILAGETHSDAFGDF